MEKSEHKILSRTARIHLMVWASLVVTGVLVFSFYFPFQLVLIHALGNAGLLVILFYGCTWVVNRFIERRKIAAGVVVGIFLFTVVNTFRILINLALLKQFPSEMHPNLAFSPLLRVSALVLTTSAFITVFGISYQMILNQNRKEAQTLVMLQAQQAAQLQFLKAQINPHFLFNALNNIYSLTVVQSREAPKMLLRLSDLLRYVIYEGQKEKVALEREVQHIRNFIDLFNMRSETPANIEFKVTGDISQMKIEPMILIPMVENCFKHADFDTNPTAFAKLELVVDSIGMAFNTTNTFDAHNQQKDDTGGVGLENIQRRLELRYPEQHSFEVKSEGNIFEVSLSLHSKH